MQALAARLHLVLAARPAVARLRGERGQSTVEYALVILAAAALALVVVAWAARTGRIDALFNSIIDSVTSKVA